MVKEGEEHLWDALLGTRDFLLEHSRQETEYLNAVMAQKPVWTSGPECCSWADLGWLFSQLELQEAEEEGEIEGILQGKD